MTERTAFSWVVPYHHAGRDLCQGTRSSAPGVPLHPYTSTGRSANPGQ